VLAQNYPAVGLGVAALVIVVFVLKGLLRRRKRGDAEEQLTTETQRHS
jgi:cytochrome c-type biogenesis protein CcmH/NrfF